MAGPESGRRGGRAGITGLLIVIVAVGMMLIVRARPDVEPFDPRSGRADGARALVLLLRDLGATVDIVRTPPAPGTDGRVLLLDDRLSRAQRDDLEGWVAAGGIAVVADPNSSLHGGSDLGTPERVTGSLPDVAVPQREVEAELDIPRGTCTIDALDDLRGIFVRDGIRFPVPAATDQCFSSGDFAFVFTRPVGDGLIVGFGDNYLFTNGLIRYADNSGLAAALLAPVSGSRVIIVVGDGPRRSPTDVGTGDDTLADLVRPGVWMALAQLALAFLVFAVARAVRVGRPVDEPVPVPVAGSELVVATGNLMQRAHHHERAGWLVRGATYRELCRRLSLPPTVSIEQLDREAVRRFGLPPGEVAAALHSDTSDVAGLVALGNRLDRIRDRADQPGDVPSIHEAAPEAHRATHETADRAAHDAAPPDRGADR